MKENKQYVIKLDGKLIPVSEEVYLEYYRSDRHARYLEEKDARHGVVHYSDMDTDELNGEDMIPDLNAEQPEDKAVHKILLERLRACLDLLTDDERGLVDALFFSNNGDGMSERDHAKISGIPQQTINYRKVKIIGKLKKLLGN